MIRDRFGEVLNVGDVIMFKDLAFRITDIKVNPRQLVTLAQKNMPEMPQMPATAEVRLVCDLQLTMTIGRKTEEFVRTSYQPPPPKAEN